MARETAAAPSITAQGAAAQASNSTPYRLCPRGEAQLVTASRSAMTLPMRWDGVCRWTAAHI